MTETEQAEVLYNKLGQQIVNHSKEFDLSPYTIMGILDGLKLEFQILTMRGRLKLPLVEPPPPEGG